MICLEVLIKWWGVFHFKLGPAALSPSVGPSFHWTTKIHPYSLYDNRYRKLCQHCDCHGGQVFVRLWACEWMIAYMNVRMPSAGCSFAYLGLFLYLIKTAIFTKHRSRSLKVLNKNHNSYYCSLIDMELNVVGKTNENSNSQHFADTVCVLLWPQEFADTFNVNISVLWW